MSNKKQQLESDLKEYDLSTEEWRMYQWTNTWGQLEKITINNPIKLIVRSGGSTHRVVTKGGDVYCVPAPEKCGVALIWRSKDTNKPVDF